MGRRYNYTRVRRIPLRVIKDERGVMLLMAVIVVAVFLILAGIGADLARWYVANEQNQTAVDAASLAGALHGQRYVTIEVQYGHIEKKCHRDSNGHKKCKNVCVSDPPVIKTGDEKSLVEEGGWEKGTCCDKFLGIKERWIEYPNDTNSVAEAVFNYNTPGMLTSRSGGKQTALDINSYDSGSYAPSVSAKSQGSIKTELLHIIGIDTIGVNNCGQSGTFYNIISGGKDLGRNGAPKNACQ